MEFDKKLNLYIELLGCSSKELATSSGLSPAVISRYRNGERTPSFDSKQFTDLVKGIVKLSKSNELLNLSIENVTSDFIGNNTIDFETIRNNFNKLVSVLDINISKMSRAIGFDASYISRIRSGKRKPSDLESFIKSVCDYIVKNINDEKINLISNLINCPTSELNNKDVILSKLQNWIFSNAQSNTSSITTFLEKLDDFNLEEYIRIIHFDTLKIPNIPFQLPISKNYYKLDGLKQGELDFFKYAVISKDMDPVFMYNDMPVEDMSKDVEFGKKWMFAIAMLLKKGLHLNYIHNLNRSINEIMIGLEGWIPIYMTGQISPYYLKDYADDTFNHSLYVSGSTALSGEGIKNHHSSAKYYVTNKKDEVSYYKKRASDLLKKAKPLMEIYSKDNSKEFQDFMSSIEKENVKYTRTLSSLPLFTIPNNLLDKIIDRTNLSDGMKIRIKEYVSTHKKGLTSIIEKSNIVDRYTILTEKEFNEFPMYLPLSDLFFEEKIEYTYEEYLEHLKATKEFAKTHSKYSFKTNVENAFRNINITICNGKWALISKVTNPSIHFLIKHPKLRQSIEDFSAPIIGK